MKRRGIEFARSLIKGRIAETIFHSMMEEIETCTIIPFGYENYAPVLAQYQYLIEEHDALKNIRNTPDFILVSRDHRHVRLVDVKYRRQEEPKRMKQIAEDICKHWITSWLFLATPEGFFFSPCSDIVKADGVVAPLPTELVNQELQTVYLSLLNEFEP